VRVNDRVLHLAGELSPPTLRSRAGRYLRRTPGKRRSGSGFHGHFPGNISNGRLRLNPRLDACGNVTWPGQSAQRSRLACRS
jgi:hypothetical protein